MLFEKLGIVRDVKTPAPLRAYAGLPFTLYIGLMLLISVYFWLPLGFPGLLLHVCFSALNMLLDCLVSNSPSHNARCLRANGFSDAAVLRTVLLNLLSSSLTAFLVVQHAVSLSPALASPRLLLAHLAQRPLASLAAVLLDLALAELAFALAHRLLHERPLLAGLHVMHHCCRRSSFSTNLVFHPLDLAMEFSGPVAVLLLTHWLLWQDAAVLWLSFIILQVWYALDHDEGLRLYPVSYTHLTLPTIA